jgi:hypothetical protein
MNFHPKQGSMRGDAWMNLSVSELSQLSRAELQKLWSELTKAAAPTRISQELLLRAVAFRIQEARFGGLERSCQERLNQATSPVQKRSPSRALKPGTKLIRQWQGQTYEVACLSEGKFLFQGETYSSLSVIAEVITGAHWSGPRFFGLKPEKRRNSDG